MSLDYVCRLCRNICTNFVGLCDGNGQYTEVYEITTQFFHPQYLGLEPGSSDGLNVLCFECWHHISGFHNFQQSVLLVHTKLLEDSEHSTVALAKLEDLSQDSDNVPAISQQTDKEFIALADAETESIHVKTEEIDCSSLDLKLKDLNEDSDNVPTFSQQTDNEFVTLADGETESIHVKTEEIDCDSMDSSDSISTHRDNAVKVNEEFEEPIGSFGGDESNEPSENSYSNFSFTEYKLADQLTSSADERSAKRKTNARTRKKTNLRRKSWKQLDDVIAKWIPVMICELCQKATLTFTDLLLHFREHHPKERGYHRCCQRKFKSRGKLEEHVQLHFDPKSFMCKVCKKCFTAKFTLESHMFYQHPKRLNDSNAKEDNPDEVYAHKQANYKYKCDICDKAFKTPSALRDHTSSHTGQSLHSCSHCSKTFKYRSSLTHHMTRSHPDKITKPLLPKIIHSCVYCPMSFNCNTDLNHHIQAAHPTQFAKRNKALKRVISSIG